MSILDDLASQEPSLLLLNRARAEHALTLISYLAYRKNRLSCYSEAKDAAAGKPVTDTALDRAYVERFGEEGLEEGKSLYFVLLALESQILALSTLLEYSLVITGVPEVVSLPATSL